MASPTKPQRLPHNCCWSRARHWNVSASSRRHLASCRAWHRRPTGAPTIRRGYVEREWHRQVSPPCDLAARNNTRNFSSVLVWHMDVYKAGITGSRGAVRELGFTKVLLLKKYAYKSAFQKYVYKSTFTKVLLQNTFTKEYLQKYFYKIRLQKSFYKSNLKKQFYKSTFTRVLLIIYMHKWTLQLFCKVTVMKYLCASFFGWHRNLITEKNQHALKTNFFLEI